MRTETAISGAGVARVSLFGAFRVTDAGGKDVAISNRRARALLAVLCLLGGETVEREQLSRLLWPGRFKAQARASLRQCLHDLNRQLREAGLDLLDPGHARIGVHQAALRTDLFDLERAFAEGHVDAAAEILSLIGEAPLLDDLELGDPLAEWLAARRRHVEARLRIAFQRLLAGLGAEGEEEACGRLLKAWRRQGAQSGRDEGVRLAVLPFEQVDAAGGRPLLAEGILDELSVRLGAIPGLKLAGRTSVAAVTGQGATLPELARALGVSHLIEGTLRHDPEHVEVTVRLIDGADGTETWSGGVTAGAQEFVTARQVLGSQLLADLCRALGVEPPARRPRRMTANRDAYALYLQGRSLVQRAMTDGAAGKAIELLTRALDLDPQFAECWAALGDAHIHTAVFTPCRERVARSAEAARCADRAIALDPGQGHAHAIRGIHAWTCANPSAALDSAFEAFRLEPNNADVTARLGSFLLYIGRTREALPYIEAAVDLDPVYGRNYGFLCTARFSLGDMDGALAAGQRMVDLGMPGMWLAVVQAAAGDRATALETYYRSRLLMGSVILLPPGMSPMGDAARDTYWTVAAKGVTSGHTEDSAAYRQLLEGLHATMADPHDPSIAFPAIWMGHAELVMKIYRERIHPANMFGLMSLWADVEPIRQTIRHPGFMAFAEEIGLVSAWQKHGWPDLIPHDPRRN